MRQERSKPIVEAFDRGMSEQTVLPKSAIGEAIAYATRQWAALNRYLEDGDLSIDNTVAERAQMSREAFSDPFQHRARAWTA